MAERADHAVLGDRKADRHAHFHAPPFHRSHGGKLSLVAEFPDREPVMLAGITSLDV